MKASNNHVHPNKKYTFHLVLVEVVFSSLDHNKKKRIQKMFCVCLRQRERVGRPDYQLQMCHHCGSSRIQPGSQLQDWLFSLKCKNTSTGHDKWNNYYTTKIFMKKLLLSFPNAFFFVIKCFECCKLPPALPL